ncbi:hypothetical protein, partial [Thiolapillus sp.]|uniref:hypothetical protein n=1 Tax=Thiolapillus sp. TaxID=2017437 RepID=UPI003AF7206E
DAVILASMPACWPRCRLAGLDAGLLASMPACWPRCRLAGLDAGLLVSMSVVLCCSFLVRGCVYTYLILYI